MDQNTIIYMAVCVLAILLATMFSSRFGIVSIFVYALAGLSFFVLMLMAFADFLIMPLFTKLFKITIVPAKGFTITSGQDSVIKYSNGIYYATGYITANVYNYVFATERETEEEPEITAAPEKWEKAVMNIHFPFKFNIIVSAEDIQQHREELETKRGLLEFQYSRELQSQNPNPMSLENMQRQINIIQTRIDKIGEGEKPVNSLMYIESTAVGVSLKEATDALTNQLTELQTVFNIFDLSLTRIAGRELYHLFKLNHQIPVLNDLLTTFNVQK
jgi:hypothetical protein